MSTLKELHHTYTDLLDGKPCSLLDAAYAYILDGYTITLVGADKRPIGKWGPGGWNRFGHSNAHELATGRATGIAVITGSSNLAVLDFDDADTFARACDEHNITETRIAQTPRGYHAYFNAPEHATLKPRHNIIPGLDLRAAESYIILPPSTMHHGTYTWANANPILDMPTSILELVS